MSADRQCADYGQQVSDRAGAGRHIQIEHGYADRCRSLAREQAAHAVPRCTRLPTLVASSEPAVGSVQRHRLSQRVVMTVLVPSTRDSHVTESTGTVHWVVLLT